MIGETAVEMGGAGRRVEGVEGVLVRCSPVIGLGLVSSDREGLLIVGPKSLMAVFSSGGRLETHRCGGGGPKSFS